MIDSRLSQSLKIWAMLDPAERAERRKAGDCIACGAAKEYDNPAPLCDLHWTSWFHQPALYFCHASGQIVEHRGKVICSCGHLTAVIWSPAARAGVIEAHLPSKEGRP